MRDLPISLLSAAAILLSACAAGPTPRQQILDAFKAADADGDEQLTPEEFAHLPLSGVKFEDIDTDGNGRITYAELQSYLVWRRVQADGNRLPASGPAPHPP